MNLSSKTPRAIADIFESPSEDEDFHGFGVTAEPVSEDSRDSLYSGASEKPVLCFRSKFITTELVRVFTESEAEDEEFEGFSEEEGSEGRITEGLNTQSAVSEEESDVDTGFYSEGEESGPPKRKSLCVAFRFPTKRIPTLKKDNKRQPIRAAQPERRASERARLKRGVAEVGGGSVGAGEAARRLPEMEEEEDRDEVKMDVLPHALSKRDKNIQENKAMLAKLFADLSSMAELTPLTSPKKKRRVTENLSPGKRASGVMEGGGRKNPSRKARPPENFGVEKSESPTRLSRPAKIIDIRKLIEVDDELRAAGGDRKRRSSGGRKRRREVRSVDDITQEELDNVAQRSKDKILDKENGSTCHQCRQKTLDTKTVCRSGYCVGGKGQFCGPCLKNRYGEDVCETLLDPTWKCPLCRGMCNCSLCRRKEGRCATGNLVRLAQYNGKSNVHQYLQSIQRDLK